MTRASAVNVATEADHILALKVESRAAYLQSLSWPSAPWTDGDHKRFTDASDRWDGAYSKEYRADGLDFNRAILRPRSKGDRS